MLQVTDKITPDLIREIVAKIDEIEKTKVDSAEVDKLKAENEHLRQVLSELHTRIDDQQEGKSDDDVVKERVIRVRGASPIEDPFSLIYTQVFPAKLNGAGTSTNNNKYTFAEQTLVGGSLGTFTDGRTCTDATEAFSARELNGWKDIPADTKVLMWSEDSPTGVRYCFALPIPVVPDYTKNYVLTYVAADKKLTWQEYEDCA